MSDDLVKRLREGGSRSEVELHEDREEAANRIEELEAANKLLNEQLNSIEEMGTESLNALPDCLMQLAPALVENDELKVKLKMAVEALGQARNDAMMEVLDASELPQFAGNGLRGLITHLCANAKKIKGEQP